MIPESGTAPQKHVYEMLFVPKEDRELPAVGDSVRFSPGVATDLGNAHPHLKNPWVRIVGDLTTKVDATTFVIMDPTTYPEGTPTVTPCS